MDGETNMILSQLFCAALMAMALTAAFFVGFVAGWERLRKRTDPIVKDIVQKAEEAIFHAEKARQTALMMAHAGRRHIDLPGEKPYYRNRHEKLQAQRAQLEKCFKLEGKK